MRNFNNRPSLSSLCLRIPKPRKQAIENIKKIIEQYRNYIFVHNDYKTYLQWNKP
jgi:hypothetical protein